MPSPRPSGSGAWKILSLPHDLEDQVLHLIAFLPYSHHVTDCPRALEDPAVQVLQECAHKIAEEGRAQQAEERAEDNNIVSRLVSATMSSEFRAATGAQPRQYAIR